MRTTFFIMLMLISPPVFGGEIYVVNTKADADVLVYVTKFAFQADLFVVVTDVGLYAKKTDWFWKYVNYKLPSVIKVYFTQWSHEADVIVYFTTYSPGWKKSNKFSGRLH